MENKRKRCCPQYNTGHPFQDFNTYYYREQKAAFLGLCKGKKGLIEESYNANFNYLKDHLPEILKEFEYYLSKSQIFIKLGNFNAKTSKHT